MRDIDMRPLVEALTMNLDRLDRFPENLKLKGLFHLRDGTLSRVDLAQVAAIRRRLRAV